MVDLPRTIAIVQARGGSQGIPRKNLQLLAGHPLVAYSIVSALAARSISRVIVSTDDEEIAGTCRKYGAEVPFIRPAAIATSGTPDLPVFQHALAWLEAEGQEQPELIVQLRPTSPLRPRGLIDRAVELLAREADADCVRGVMRTGQTPYKMWRPGDRGALTPLMHGEFDEPYNMPRQALPPVFWQTGHIDVIRRRTIVEQGSLTGRRVLPLVIEPSYCIDIDSSRDLALAEWTINRCDVDIDRPDASATRAWPARIGLLVLDFDGVMTDNRVWLNADGQESVACSRGDGMGLARLRQAGVEAMVLSTEVNSVVAARCRKLNLACVHGLKDKAEALRAAAHERGIGLADVVYVGNDINDLECMAIAGFAAAPADAHAEALAAADLRLHSKGGFGAVREVCDEIVRRLGAARGESR